MTDPVKTLVLKALETMLAEVTGIGSVRRWEEFPLDPDSLAPAEVPALFIWEDEDRDRKGRLAWNKLNIHLQVYLKLPEDTGYTGFSEAAEDLAAKIQVKLAAPAPLRIAGAVQIEEGEVHKSKVTEFWGQLIMPYQITYAHALGNPFSKII